MNAYMVFSREAGSEHGAILVFANTALEARKLAWESNEFLNIEEWIDVTTWWFKDEEVLKLSFQYPSIDTPHVVTDPIHCTNCDLWGCGITPDNKCKNCGEHPGDELIHCLTSDPFALLDRNKKQEPK